MLKLWHVDQLDHHKRKWGEDLYRIAPLDEIIGSAYKIHMYKLQKNLKLV